MATCNKIICGICEGQHLTKCADNWCPECDEGLCNDCEKHHRLSKASRNHAIISIDDYQKLPADVSKIGHQCEDHGRKFEIFCPKHDKLCCPICISVNHESCSGLKALDDVVKASKTSTLIENLELSIIEISKHIKFIISDRQRNLTEIEVEQKRFKDEIKQTREKINCLLDKLETTLIIELVEEENKIKLQIQSLLSKLEERNETVGNLQNNLVAIKTHATDLQIFFGCKTLSEQVSKEEKYIESLYENGSLQEINLKCDISDKVSDILTMVTSFGSISIGYNPPLVLLTKEKDKQAQIVVPVEIQPTKSIDRVSLTIHKKLEVPISNLSNMTGMGTSPSGKVVIVDYGNKRLVLFSPNGFFDKLISLSPQYPYDVTCLDDSMIAVSILNKNVIKLVNIVSGTVSQTIYTKYVCDGITQREGKLIYCGREHGIIVHDPNGNTSTTIVKDAIDRLNYVTTFKDNIYHTINNTVSCYKSSGERVWNYKDSSILKTTYGITVDNHSNVYVASAGTNSVVIISPDGKHARPILKAEDGNYPRAIHFDKNRNALVVACYNGVVNIYNVQ